MPLDIRSAVRNLVARAARFTASSLFRSRYKANEEMRHWRARKRVEGTLANGHYQEAFTTLFGLPVEFYAGKRILDLGCGPRGSLEWATMAAERIGADPLADRYLRLGADQHRMRYVKTGSEATPFRDAQFDVVSTFNSLDHVDDVGRTVAEIARITRPGGSLLVLVEVNHPPRPAEPHRLGWDLVDRFRPWFTVADEKRFEYSSPQGIYDSLRAAIPYDDAAGEHEGILLARFIRA